MPRTADKLLDIVIVVLFVLSFVACIALWIIGLFHRGPVGHNFAIAAGICGCAAALLFVLLVED